jgi:hypothetical protein
MRMAAGHFDSDKRSARHRPATDVIRQGRRIQAGLLKAASAACYVRGARTEVGAASVQSNILAGGDVVEDEFGVTNPDERPAGQAGRQKQRRRHTGQRGSPPQPPVPAPSAWMATGRRTWLIWSSSKKMVR